METLLTILAVIAAAIGAVYIGWWALVGLLILGVIIKNTISIPDRSKELQQVLKSYRE